MSQGFKLSKNAGIARAGFGALEFQSCPAATGADFSRKKLHLAGFAAGIRRISAKSGEGGGRTFFLVHQLVKKSFGTSQSPETLCLRAFSLWFHTAARAEGAPDQSARRFPAQSTAPPCPLRPAAPVPPVAAGHLRPGQRLRPFLHSPSRQIIPQNAPPLLFCGFPKVKS